MAVFRVEKARDYPRGGDGQPLYEKAKPGEECDEYGNKIYHFKKKENRSQDLRSVAKSLHRLRDIISTNITNPEDMKRCLFITLTYKSNMKDPERLYADFKDFNRKMRNHLKANGHPTHEYIVAVEPQARGAWHAHVIMIFPDTAPTISRSKITKLWGHGIVDVKPLTGDINDLGRYLIAYLSNMSLEDTIAARGLQGVDFRKVKGKSISDENGNKIDKAFVKGSRLHLYPVGFHLYRTSKGIKMPVLLNRFDNRALQMRDIAHFTSAEAQTYSKALEYYSDKEATFINNIWFQRFDYNTLVPWEDCTPDEIEGHYRMLETEWIRAVCDELEAEQQANPFSEWESLPDNTDKRFNQEWEQLRESFY